MNAQNIAIFSTEWSRKKKLRYKSKTITEKDRSAMCTIKNSVREMKNRYTPQILRKFGNKSKHRSVDGTGNFLRGRVLKLSRRIRELATRDLLDKSIVGQVRCRTNSGGVSYRITVGIAEINSLLLITKIVILS